MKEWHLRFSVTPNCNFACVYCNPEGLKEESTVLTESEIVDITKAASEIGITRVHWTGGEPTLLNLEKLISKARENGITDQIVTTNGSKGGEYIKQLIMAGMTRLIVSLDSIDPERNYLITRRRSFPSTLDSIETGVRMLDAPTKMNIVSMLKTAEEIPRMVEYASSLNSNPENKGKLVLKMIELCPNNPIFYSSEGENLYRDAHITRDQVIKSFSKWKLVPTSMVGDNPNADYHHVGDTGVIVGLVTMPSLDYKCGKKKCRKLRVNPFGYSGVCIGMEPVKLKGSSHDEIVEKLNYLTKYREELDTTRQDRKHYNGEFGFWRFGLCDRNK